MSLRPRHDEGVTSPVGTALTIGIVVLMAIGLSFMVRVFMDRSGTDQSLATFSVNESDDTLTVQRVDHEVMRSNFEMRLTIAGDFDVVPLTNGTHAFAANVFVPMGGGAGGPPDAPMTVGTKFYFCTAGNPGESVSIDIRDVNTNALIWRGGFTNLAACP